MSDATGPLARQDLIAAVFEGLGVDPQVADVEVREVSEHSNFNHVYRAWVDGVSFYLKVAAAQPKRFPVRLPRQRLLSEATALQRFGELCGDDVLVPEVLFVDRERFVLGLTDVGDGRQVLLGLLPGGYSLLVEAAAPLGRAVGRVHRGSRGMHAFRPSSEDALVRRVIYDGLLAPGAKALFPGFWDELRLAMATREECLVHADLWSKNLLVGPGRTVSVVDFEGAHLGDPAFDLATLFAAALIPALDRTRLHRQCRELVAGLRHGYREGSGAVPWAEAALQRAYRLTGTFLAARGYGPFPYEMTETGRLRLSRLAWRLTASPPADARAFDAAIAEALRRRAPGARPVHVQPPISS